ncbi:hypothetical protein [Sediminibacterium sp.]|uniref:HYC_CC_PP family protein n=1 Tax=Sediminibacterium sp. TaxID=1917865 RepID=UPI0025CFB299|nr:hypothetical protein [Sediminibacterium sp.]MBW0176569.1 hypothetical protein [Sediminibacterium sp.]
MKRVLTSLIAIIYFVISSGLVMSIHYCMGKISSVDLSHNSTETCVCGMSLKETSSKGCCKTEIKMVKLEDNHKATYAFFDFQSPVTLLPKLISVFDLTDLNESAKVYADIHGPPLLSRKDTYLLNCVFRI